MRISVTHGEDWAQAMEAYAPFGVRLMPEPDDVTHHQIAMIEAGAAANYVPRLPSNKSASSPIVSYIQAKIDLDAAIAAF